MVSWPPPRPPPSCKNLPLLHTQPGFPWFPGNSCPPAASPDPTKMGSARSAPPSFAGVSRALQEVPAPRATALGPGHTPRLDRLADFAPRFWGSEPPSTSRLLVPPPPGHRPLDGREGARWPRAAYCPHSRQRPWPQGLVWSPEDGVRSGEACQLRQNATEVGGAGRSQSPVSRQGYRVPDNQTEMNPSAHQQLLLAPLPRKTF